MLCRFTTTGDQALKFEILKYGRPDPQMERPFDIRACVEMTSVRYLHTMRFLKEMLAFCSHFPQLIDAFQRMKAMAQGNLVSHIRMITGVLVRRVVYVNVFLQTKWYVYMYMYVYV